MKITCAQRGCVFEAEEMPDNCAVCNNPLPGATSQDDDDELTWLDYTVEELRQQATDWDLEGWNKRSTKAELIELLEQFEAAEELEQLDIEALRKLANDAGLGEGDEWDADTTREQLIELLEAASEGDDD